MAHFILISIIILLIMVLQAYLFIITWMRMNEFCNTFESGGVDYSIEKDPETNFVNGILVKKNQNSIFRIILKSINQYLANNKATVIDFQLLKDTVDRNCDSVEEDINTQIPIPLYLGLAGTMAGIIVGVGYLWLSGSLNALLGTGSSAMATKGVEALLSGVAIAMIASICGIIFTTINSYRFKDCKLKEEMSKNEFLTWMQATLLPELSTDTADALTKLTHNLNRFNNNFAENTTKLSETLNEVNLSYATQAEIIQNIHDLDVIKIATANIHVLDKLQNCTDKLEQFNEYLDSVKGYTDTIHDFNEQFNSEANRLHVFEDIRDFFREELTQIEQRKSEISKSVANVDEALGTALKELVEKSKSQIDELKKSLIEQDDSFKEFIRDGKKSFTDMSTNVRDSLNEQMRKMPEIYKKLDEISDIPQKLNELMKEIKIANNTMIQSLSQEIKKGLFSNPSEGAKVSMTVFPQWMNWAFLIILIIIASTCIYTTWHTFQESSPTDSSEININDKKLSPIDKKTSNIWIKEDRICRESSLVITTNLNYINTRNNEDKRLCECCIFYS